MVVGTKILQSRSRRQVCFLRRWVGKHLFGENLSHKAGVKCGDSLRGSLRLSLIFQLPQGGGRCSWRNVNIPATALCGWCVDFGSPQQSPFVTTVLSRVALTIEPDSRFVRTACARKTTPKSLTRSISRPPSDYSPSTGDYSVLNASMGLTRVARRAGTKHDAAATVANNAATAV